MLLGHSTAALGAGFRVAQLRGVAPQLVRLSESRVRQCRSSDNATSVATVTTDTANGNGNGNGSQEHEPSSSKAAPLASGELRFVPMSDTDKNWTNFKLAFALPWRRFKRDSVLTFKLDGEITEKSRGMFDKGNSVPQVCSALRKAALDPRIKGICVEIGPLGIGWGKVQEIRRYISYFRESGKFSVVYMKSASEKEFYLASAFEELYMPPSASLSLRGFAVSGTFLRGVFEKVGIEPQVKRIGKYKSAGDQLLRKDMSEAQSEQLTAILEDIYEEFTTTVAKARGKTKEEVRAMLEEGIFDMKRFHEGGWVDALRYEDEVIEDMKARTGGKPDELRKVGLSRYNKVSPSAFKLTGKKRIAVLRTSGAILGGSSGASSSSITPNDLLPQLRALAKDKGVAAVVLRVDSPGGDALASDLMWREIKQLGLKKPVVASMSDVAASGGYYMAMACQKIIAEPLTVTGSIGVVTGKFNLAELYEKIGYAKTTLSRGRFAELLTDNRPFTPAEQELFDRAADHAYASFRNKAAESRGMSVEAMQEVAQGRVWTGARALGLGLVDGLGGVHRAIAVAKQLAEIPEDERVTVMELGRARPSPLALLGGSASVTAPLLWMPVLWAVLRGESLERAVTAVLGGMASSMPTAGVPRLMADITTALTSAASGSGAQCLMVDVDAASVGGLAPALQPGASYGSTSSFLSEGDEGGL